MNRKAQDQQLLSAFLALVSQCHGLDTVLPEIALFVCGKKRGLRLHGNLGILTVTQKMLSPCGLHVSGFRSVSRCLGGTWSELVCAEDFDEDKNLCLGEVVTISKNKSMSKDLADAERSDAYAMGKLLDYPPCCIDAMMNTDIAGEAWPKSLLTRTNGGARAEANRLPLDWGGLSPIGEMFPCSLACEHACRIGKESVDSLRQLGLKRLANMVVSHATAWFRINAEGRAMTCNPNDNNAQRLLWGT